jgi:TonB family protein
MNIELEERKESAVAPPLNRAPANAPAPRDQTIHTSWGDEDEAPQGFKKWRAPLIVGLLTIAGLFVAVKVLSKADGRAAKKDSITTVQLHLPPAPPPPPPPPPPPDSMKEEKMIEAEKEEDAPPDPAPAVDTALKGPGTGAIPVAAGNRGMFGGRNNGPSIKARWASYASQIQGQIADGLRNNPRTRKANARAVVRIWVDGTGRVTRAQLGGSTGNKAVDDAIENEVLKGAQFREAPPAGMPMPIVLRVTARRPN